MDESPEALERMVRRRMAIRGLVQDGGPAGLRPFLLAKHLELCGPTEPVPRPRDDVLAAMAQNGPAPNGAPDGPYVFVRAVHESPGHAEHVPILLVHPERDVRAAALEYVERGATATPAWVSPFTVRILQEYGSSARAEGFEEWFPAATRIADVLEDDFLACRAAFAQCVACGLHEDAEEWWDAMLRPAAPQLLAAGSLHSSADCDDRMQRIARSAPTLADALEQYYAWIGHLPLANRMSAGRLLRSWREHHAAVTEDCWTSVWQWAASDGSPLRQYHACRIFAECPEEIPAGASPEFWQKVMEIVEVLGAERRPETTRHELEWLIPARLSQYFLEYLELHCGPQPDDRHVGVAWWAAERVASALTLHADRIQAPLPFLREFHRRTQNAAGITEFARSLTRLHRYHSTARYSLLHVSAPWSLALLCAIAPEAASTDIGQLSNETQVRLGSAVAAALLSAFPWDAPAGSDGGIWAMDAPLVQVARRMIPRVGDAELGRFLEAAVQGHAAMCSPAWILDGLRRIAEVPEADHRFLSSGFCALAYAGALPREEATGLMQDDEWCASCFRAMSTKALAELGDGLRECQSHWNGDWNIRLPHVFRRAAHMPDIDAEKRRYFVLCTVESSAIAGTASAIRRRAEGAFGDEIEKALRDWKQMSSKIWNDLPAYVAARLRDIVSSIS